MESIFSNVFLMANSPSLFYSVVANLTLFYASQNLEYDKQNRPNPNPRVEEVYDFIVVGAGSAGGIVASRLSENKNISVLLLEKGDDPLPINSVPFMWLDNVGHEETDWKYSTVPQTNCALAYANNSILEPRGKSLGGTSNLNAIAFWRGNPHDFNRWANLTNDEQWSYKELLTYFKKLENYDGSFADTEEYHGNSGPIPVTRQTYPPLKQEWIAAGKQMGFPYADPDAEQTSTFIPVDVSGLNGRRWEVFKGYLEKAEERDNLKIMRNAHVLKINLNGDNTEAESVTYQRHDEIITAKATKEIIISAGAYNSPQILMLSGIGPEEHLSSVGITTKVNLPGVGENYQDHVVSTIGPFLLNDTVSFVRKRDLNAKAVIDYITSGTGPLSWNLLQGHGLYSTNGRPNWPNIIYHHMPVGGGDCTLLNPLKSGICDEYMKGVDEEADAMWAIMFLGLPQSKGTIRLQSKNPFDAPLIDPKLFSHSQDMKDMVQGFKFLMKLYEETDGFQKYNASLTRNKFPGCESFTEKSDGYFECYLRHITRTMYHPSSTCKMGSKDDSMAVVDSNLKVRGVSKLRIADASIMPDISNVNINGATMMIGEKAASIIMKEWMSSSKSRDASEKSLYRTSIYMLVFCILLMWILYREFGKKNWTRIQEYLKNKNNHISIDDKEAIKI